MKSIFIKKLFSLTLGFALFLLYIPHLSADEKSSDESAVLDMITGDIQTITVHNLTRVSVTDPDTADIADAQSDKISVLAKKPGDTILFLWDDKGKRSVKIRVANEDLDGIKEKIQRLLDEAKITGITLDENMDIGKVVLEGAISKDDKARLDDTLDPYSDNLLNLVKIEKNEDLIEVDMQVLEIDTTFEQTLGIDWSNTANGLSLTYGEQGVPLGLKAKDLFKIGNFERTTPLQATINLLLQEGKARIISKPRLVVVSGKQASFLVGGEIPIESTTTNTTGLTLTSNTTYAQYGVNMTVTPTIRDGKIEVILNVDIRDVDTSPPTGTNGIAFITRTASTNLLMDNKQTIALAGLIKHTDSVNVNAVPYLSKIPVIGTLFRSTATPNTNTEMIVILTPTVMTDKKIADHQLAMPTPEERNADNEVNTKYESEPLPSWPAAKATVTPTAAPIVTPTEIPATISREVPSPKVVSPEALSAMTSYARMVQIRISKAITYPKMTSKSLAGTVKLKLHILKDGSLDSEEVIESSGNNVLDQDALQAAKAAAPYDVFSSGISDNDLLFTIPIVYNKTIFQGSVSAEKVIAAY